MLKSLWKQAPRKKANRLLSFLLLIAAPLLAFELFPIMQLHTAREAELRQDASHFLDLVDAELSNDFSNWSFRVFGAV